MSTPAAPSRPGTVEVTSLTRRFSVRPAGAVRRTTVTAVDSMTFAIGEGESVGYIGANGAGKSTTIKMLAGILVPTSGSVRTCGLDPIRRRRELASSIGVVFGQRSQLWWDLPVSESFAILGDIHRMTAVAARDRASMLVDSLDLAGFWSTPVRQLSLGQRMRAEVGAALLHSPALLVLDEPTIGLDVLSKQQLRQFLMQERSRRPMTVLLTTHDMGDIQRLCDRVLVVDRGRLAFDGTLPALAAAADAPRVLVLDLAAPAPDLVGIPGTHHLGSEVDGMRQRLALDGPEVTVPAVLQSLGDRVQIRDLSVEEPDIEAVVRRLYAR